MSEKSSLAIFERASQMLAEADTIQKAKELKNLALTAADWAKRKGMGEEAIRHCRSYALEAERKMGEMLAQTERAKGAAAGGKKNGSRGKVLLPRDSQPTLAELGLTKRESARAQKLATISTSDFRDVSSGKVSVEEVFREIRKQTLSKKIAALPNNKYRVIYAGEMIVAAWLKFRGNGIIPSYDYTGTNGDKAPRLVFQSGGLVIPDLDVCHNGNRAWFEVKTYHGPAENKRHNCLVHGVEKRLYDDYLKVEKETGSTVYIVILEYKSGELLIARLRKIETLWPCQCSACAANKPQRCQGIGIKRGIYWPRSEMVLWHKFPQETMKIFFKPQHMVENEPEKT